MKRIIIAVIVIGGVYASLGSVVDAMFNYEISKWNEELRSGE